MPTRKQANPLRAKKAATTAAASQRSSGERFVPNKSVRPSSRTRRTPERQGPGNRSKDKASQPSRNKSIRAASSTTKWTKKQKRPPQGPRKRFRRYKRLRPCVLPMTFLIPLTIILLEQYLGVLFQLDDFKDAYNEQMGIDPWQIEPPIRERIGAVPLISNLTYTPRLQCPRDTRRMINVHNPQTHSISSRRIPMIIHQTSKSRCLTRNFDRATIRWAFRRWSYYFHDDDAVDRLLQAHFPEFPHLKLVVKHCVKSRSAILGLWRYLVLWVYGGVYADLNTYPTDFNATTIKETDDGFFFMEPNSLVLSTKVMAVSPRHPLMYYAVQYYIDAILRMRNVDSKSPRKFSPVEALSSALADFQKGQVARKKNAASSNTSSIQVLRGFGDHSIRLVVETEGDEELVTPIFISEAGLENEFSKMGMTPIGKPVIDVNCFREMFSQIRREQEAEEDQFGETERFVTSAYKAKLAADKARAEEEARLEEQEKARAKAGMAGFYANLGRARGLGGKHDGAALQLPSSGSAPTDSGSAAAPRSASAREGSAVEQQRHPVPGRYEAGHVSAASAVRQPPAQSDASGGGGGFDDFDDFEGGEVLIPGQAPAMPAASKPATVARSRSRSPPPRPAAEDNAPATAAAPATAPLPARGAVDSDAIAAAKARALARAAQRKAGS